MSAKRHRVVNLAMKNIQITNHIGKELPQVVLEELFQLFDESYEQANHNYLVASFNTFDWIALGRDKGKLVGFAVGDSKKMQLPRLPEKQSIAMAGIACIHEDYRQGGLFRDLAFSSINAGGAIDPSSPFLFCGRMAHAVSYQTLVSISDNIVPVDAWLTIHLFCN